MANKRLAKKRAKQEAAKAVEVKVEAPVVEEAVVETETPVVEEVKEEAVVVEEVPAVEEVKVEVETAPTPVAEETKEVNKLPVCKKPVGDGANLVTIAPSGKSLFGYLFSKSSIVVVIFGKIKFAKSI